MYSVLIYLCNVCTHEFFDIQIHIDTKIKCIVVIVCYWICNWCHFATCYSMRMSTCIIIELCWQVAAGVFLYISNLHKPRFINNKFTGRLLARKIWMLLLTLAHFMSIYTWCILYACLILVKYYILKPFFFSNFQQLLTCCK